MLLGDRMGSVLGRNKGKARVPRSPVTVYGGITDVPSSQRGTEMSGEALGTISIRSRTLVSTETYCLSLEGVPPCRVP